jgi:hypothetical protein
MDEGGNKSILYGGIILLVIGANKKAHSTGQNLAFVTMGIRQPTNHIVGA